MSNVVETVVNVEEVKVKKMVLPAKYSRIYQCVYEVLHNCVSTPENNVPLTEELMEGILGVMGFYDDSVKNQIEFFEGSIFEKESLKETKKNMKMHIKLVRQKNGLDPVPVKAARAKKGEPKAKKVSTETKAEKAEKAKAEKAEKAKAEKEEKAREKAEKAKAEKEEKAREKAEKAEKAKTEKEEKARAKAEKAPAKGKKGKEVAVVEAPVTAIEESIEMVEEMIESVDSKLAEIETPTAPVTTPVMVEDKKKKKVVKKTKKTNEVVVDTPVDE